MKTSLIDKKLVVFSLVLLFSGSVLSQNPVIDSLRNELQTQIKRDSNRVKLMNRFAFKNYGINQDTLIKYAQDSRRLAKEVGYINGEARTWYLQSIYFLAMGNLDSANEAILSGLELYKQDKSTVGLYSCYDLLGTINRFKENYTGALEYFNKSLEIAKSEKDPAKEAVIMSNMGSVYSQMGDLNKAIATYQRGIDIYDSLGTPQKSLSSISNIALVYTRQDRYAEALASFQKCLTAYRQGGNKVFGSTVLLNMGMIYISMEEYDKALPHIQESLEISKELGNEAAIAKNTINLGSIYQAKNDKDKALQMFKEALNLGIKTKSKEIQYGCYIDIGDIYLENNELQPAVENFEKGLEISIALGGKREIAQSKIALGAAYFKLKNDNQAFTFINEGLKIANELSLLKYQAEANLTLSKIYKAQGNYQKALEKHQLYKSLSDSLLRNKTNKEITQLEYDYKYKLKLDSARSRELRLTNTVANTNQELEKSQRNLLLGVIIFLLTAIILGSIIFFLKLRNAKSKTQNIAIEQKLLRSQMTPHFIFNALSVLQGMILNKEEGKAVTYLSKFSKLLRIILENSREKTVILRDELVAVEDYLDLQNIEVKNPFKFSITVQETINQDVLKVPPMLMQPFIENAIEHAFGPRKENREIDIVLSMEKESLICTIRDNGIGIDEQKANQKTTKKSFATTITSERLSLLSKDFETAYRQGGNKVFGSTVLLNMGMIYISMEEYDKALPHIQESLEISKELGNEAAIAKNTINLGSIYQAKNDKDKALQMFKEALNLGIKTKSKEIQYGCYIDIGDIYLENNELQPAVENFEKGLEISIALGGKREIAQSKIALGAAYFKLKNDNQAFTFINEGLKIANELSLLKYQAEANLTLSKIYKAQGNYQKALEKHQLYKSLSDSLLRNKTNKEITQLEYDYKYKLKLDSARSRELRLTNTVANTNQELEKSQRNLLLGVIIFLLTAIILGSIIFFLKLRNAKSKTQNIAIEQKLLRSQMTPHFIFNALSVLQGMILNKEEGKAVTYLSKFSKLLRIILENSREKTVILRDELVAVEDYLDLQNIEVKNPFKFSITVQETINQDVLKVPPMLMQPFIENAIEHAFGPRKENREIDIVLSMEKESLICTIRDNGIGIDEQKANQKTTKKSFATTITSERLSLLSKDFETEGSIKVEDRKKYNEKGTLVTLTIPYKTEIAQ
jgi:sensor histidine kinase YesM/lipopolysaccharide biosynthesis regulator YciM